MQANVVKAAVKSTKERERPDDLPGDFNASTLRARANPASDVRVYARPDETVRDRLLGFFILG